MPCTAPWPTEGGAACASLPHAEHFDPQIRLDLLTCNPHDFPYRSSSCTPPDSPVSWQDMFSNFDDLADTLSHGDAEMQDRAAAAAALGARPHRDSCPGPCCHTPPDSPLPSRRGSACSGVPLHFHELLDGFADLATNKSTHALLSPPASPRPSRSSSPAPESSPFASLPWAEMLAPPGHAAEDAGAAMDDAADQQLAGSGMLDLSVDVIADLAPADADATRPTHTTHPTHAPAHARVAPSKRKRTYKPPRRNADPKSKAEHLARMGEKRAAKRDKRTALVDQAVDELPPLEGGLASVTDPELRRRFHNVLEGKRRNDLKNAYEWLHEVLPTLKHRERVPTSQILLHAVDCVQELKDEGAALMSSVADAAAQNLRLKRLLGIAH